jgi:nicotinate-nucleotide adenylyltransferase
MGGTFDPPHAGHLQMIQIVQKSGLVDKILVIPCFYHVFGKQPEKFIHRIKMCELMTENFVDVQVMDIEKSMQNPGRTLELLELLADRFKDDKLRLVAGADIYLERDKWYRFESIEKLAPPIYLGRKGVNVDFNDKVSLFLESPDEVSSSNLRERLREGDGNVAGSILPAVLNYIYKHKLYGVR